MGKKRKRHRPSPKNQTAPKETVVREKPEAPKKKKVQKVSNKLEHPNWLLTGLAAAGMALTAYLVITSLLDKPPLYCAEGSSCDIVQQSRWGKFLGIPTALWGFLTYAALVYIGVRVRDRASHWKTAWFISLAGLTYSLYLTAVSLISIEATCVYCLVSLAIMAAIFGVVIFQRPTELPRFNFPAWAGKTALVIVVLIGGMHLHYSGVFYKGAGPEDAYLKGLAEHLTKENALFYGAYW